MPPITLYLPKKVHERLMQERALDPCFNTSLILRQALQEEFEECHEWRTKFPELKVSRWHTIMRLRKSKRDYERKTG